MKNHFLKMIQFKNIEPFNKNEKNPTFDGWNVRQLNECVGQLQNFEIDHEELSSALYYMRGKPPAQVIPSGCGRPCVQLRDLSFEDTVAAKGLDWAVFPTVSYTVFKPWIIDSELAKFKQWKPEGLSKTVTEEWRTSNYHLDLSAIFSTVEKTGVPRYVNVRFVYPVNDNEMEEEMEDGNLCFIVAQSI